MKMKIKIVLVSLAVAMSLSGCVWEAISISEPIYDYYVNSKDGNKSQIEIKNETK